MKSSVKYPKVIPQYHSEKCPVCNGFGTLSKNKITCHACTGKGYVLVDNFSSEFGPSIELDELVDWGADEN